MENYTHFDDDDSNKSYEHVRPVTYYFGLMIADPPLPTPPNPYAAPQMAVYPTKDGQNPPGKTNSKGSGFWSGL
ncbi:hypothetical protein QQP08_020902 [Theobroma cacao]|nr:hypothetical protein QQP08_020902 [Theobroma cacao]